MVLRIAATCTIAQAARHAPWGPAAERWCRQCADAFLMSLKVWHIATVGGNLCLALPAGAMISLAAALDGDAVDLDARRRRAREPVARS